MVLADDPAGGGCSSVGDAENSTEAAYDVAIIPRFQYVGSAAIWSIDQAVPVQHL